MQINKTIMQVTILHPRGESVAGMDLGQIASEIYDGDWLGLSSIVSSEPLKEIGRASCRERV